MRFRTRLFRTSLVLLTLALAVCAFGGQTGKVGIFDLDQIHSVPLEAEVIEKTVNGGIVRESIRFTSLPGTKPLLVLTYKQGLIKRPGIIFARRFTPEARAEEAQAGFVGVFISPPLGNTDASRVDSLGGPGYDPNRNWRQYYEESTLDSPLYHHVVAMTRALDYLATRPEIDLAKSSVLGTDWAGMAVALLHAIDDRPASFFVWNGMGFYADREGKSGPSPALISRRSYELYGPASYAEHGTKPIYVGASLNSTESRFDSLLEYVRNLKSPKVLAFAPNRERGDSGAKEFSGSATWQAFWTNPFGTAPSVSEGAFLVVNGRLRYSFAAKDQASHSVVYSYGRAGGWPGRTWHRTAATPVGGTYTAEIPVFDLDTPIYVFGNGTSPRFGAMANTPQVVVPSSIGVTVVSTAPQDLLTNLRLYLATGTLAQGSNDPKLGPTARILPHWDGRIRLRNVQPFLWQGAKELVVTVKGDGAQSVLNVYFAVDSRDQLDAERENYTMIPLLKEGEVLGDGWRTFIIPLETVFDLERVDSLFFETGGKPLQIAGLRWR